MKGKFLSILLMTKGLRRQRMYVKKRWNRVMPVGDYLSDRWEKATYLGFGEGSSIYDSSLVLGDVKVGRNTWIGPFTVLDGSGGLAIGDNCSISAGVQIYSHDTVNWAISGGLEDIEKSPTEIESNVYIGPNTVIQRGVRIGRGSVIGANSLVNTNIPPDSRAWGSPCKVIYSGVSTRKQNVIAAEDVLSIKNGQDSGPGGSPDNE